MPKYFRLLPLTAAFLMGFAPIAAFSADDDVVATINGIQITEGELVIAQNELDSQFQKLPDDKKRAAALSALFEIKMMSAEAAAKGIDKDPATVRKLKFLHERALHSAFVESQLVASLSEEEIRARYDKEIAAQPPVNEVRASHILVKTEEEALAIIKRLDAGEDFAALAKEKSSDGSAAEGGDLGYFGPGRMVPEFEKAAFELEVGGYTKVPVKSQFGFHVIKVVDKRIQQPPAYEQVKEQIRSVVLSEKYFALVKSLRAAAKVEVTDPELKKAVDEIEAQK
ncbi:MAG: peptidylprolyl isomerase [Rhizobiaceae bacterium]